MGEIVERPSYNLDMKILEDNLLLGYNMGVKGHGIFTGGFDVWKYRFLPQWRLPKGLENEPITKQPKDVDKTALYLWASMIYERQISSRVLHKRLQSIWYNPDKNWFFDPFKIAEAKMEDIENVVRVDLNHPMNKPWKNYQKNSRILVEKYGGNPINVIDGCTVAEAKERTIEFHGFGSGIANLNTIHFIDRGLARIVDPEKALFKVDIHKARFPLNVGAITPTNERGIIHHYSLVEPLEKAYREICTSRKLDPVIADAIIWVLGSEGCTRCDTEWCYKIGCPVVNNCKANPPLSEKSGMFQVIDPKTGKFMNRNRRQYLTNQDEHVSLPNRDFEEIFNRREKAENLYASMKGKKNVEPTGVQTLLILD